jgi:hypothetical protein
MNALAGAAMLGLAIVGFAATDGTAQSLPQPPATAKRDGLEMQAVTTEDVVGDWEVVWSAAPDDALRDGDVRYRYFVFRSDGKVVRAGSPAADPRLTAEQLDRVAATLPAARYSLDIAGMMLLQLDDTKRQMWMISKVIEAPPGRNIQAGDLWFSVMTGAGYPSNFHILRRAPRG